MTRIAQSYWQAELSRKAEGAIPRSLLRNLFPKLALGFHTRDCIEHEFIKHFPLVNLLSKKEA